MGKVEELPDDFNESLDLNRHQETEPEPEPTKPKSPPPSQIHNDIDYLPPSDEVPFPINEERLKEIQDEKTTPKMPPAMASVKSNTTEDLLDMMNKTPLFMTDLEKAKDEKGENPLLDALMALQNEGTRGEVALNFKEQGNEAAREKRWTDAREFYNKGVAVLKVKEDHWEKPNDPEQEAKLLRDVEEAVFVNRALCNLEFRNYRSATFDCASALKLNPRNVKAYYRSSVALLALDKIPEAHDVVTRGLTLDPSNKSLQQISTKIEARKAVLENIAAKKKAEEGKRTKENLVKSAAIKARQIRTRKTPQPPDVEDAHIRLVPDPLSPQSSLEFPAVFLYPVHGESDFVKSFSELHTIADHLEYIFPLPWDEAKEYTINGVECFMDTVSGGLVKAGKKVPLLQILGGGKVEVVDELVKIYVVPTGKVGKFVEEMKARKNEKP